MSRYRILYHHRIRADDGQAVHVRELITALRALGHEVHECALVPKTAQAHRGSAPSGAWRRLQLPRAATELLEIGYGAVGQRRLLAAGRALRPHFVYERHALHCRAGLVAARQLGVPLLLEVNAPMCDEMARLGLLRWPRLARRAEAAALGGADRVLAVTDVLRQRLVECGARAERCRVIANAADPARYGPAARAAGQALRAALPKNAFVLGFLGYMRPWHRLELALEAMLRPELRRVHLVLVGSGPALPDVLARASSLQLRERVHTMGDVPGDRLPAHVCAFDAALIPAINGYASPLKLFDALAAGVVTLAPDQPNLREVIDDGVTGVLFAPDDAGALAVALAAVLADPGRACRIGDAGRRRLLERDWTWTGNARRVVACYEEVGR